MQIITYRKTDGLVFWIGDTDKPDYMGPVMRDDLAQVLMPVSQNPSWYTGWRSYSTGTIIDAPGEPEDAPRIRHWRARLVTLNMLAAAINVLRQQSVAPVYGQASVEQARANGNVELVQMYANRKGLNEQEARAMLSMQGAQLSNVFSKTEDRRLAFEVEIVRAQNWTELQAIRTRINQYLGG